MALVAIIVEDPELHRAATVERHVSGNLTALRAQAKRERRVVSTEDETRLAARVARGLETKAEGDLHTVADTDCPDGLPNCRNCGDPAHRSACRAAGHCPHCGTRHGVAPDSYLSASGVSMMPLDQAPPDGHVWDRASRRFTSKA